MFDDDADDDDGCKHEVNSIYMKQFPTFPSKKVKYFYQIDTMLDTQLMKNHMIPTLLDCFIVSNILNSFQQEYILVQKRIKNVIRGSMKKYENNVAVCHIVFIKVTTYTLISAQTFISLTCEVLLHVLKW